MPLPTRPRAEQEKPSCRIRHRLWWELKTKLFFFFTLVTGPRWSLRLKLSNTRVYEPQIRARLGTAAQFPSRRAPRLSPSATSFSGATAPPSSSSALLSNLELSDTKVKLRR